MLIRESQVKLFRAAAEQRFASEMEEHLSQFAPELARVAGMAGVQKAVQLGIKRAEDYGFTERGPIRLYIELICSFGIDFDSDPQYPWASTALQNSQYSHQTWRACQLYHSSIEYFDSVAGPNDIHARKALAQARGIEASGNEAQRDLSVAILARFQTCYPQKYGYVGEEQLRLLIARAFTASEAHGIRSDRHRALIAAVLFGFGHGALNDPLYPWIGTALRDTLVINPEDRAQRLYQRAGVYVDRMIKTLA